MVGTRSYGTIRTRVEYWPSYVDILTTVLMVFILQSFFQTALNVNNFRVVHIQQLESRLIKGFNEEFHNEIRDRKVFIDDTAPNQLQVAFSEEVLFASGEYRLAERGQAVLTRCSRLLIQHSQDYSQVEVGGHTDSVPVGHTSLYPSDNWELSAARAITVVRYMIKRQMQPVRLSAAGYSQFHPNNDVHHGAALERRVELRIFITTPETFRSKK